MSQERINAREIQWFPGHMAKTLRLMSAEMKNVDIVLQLLDARIPFSSMNPEIEKLCGVKPKLYVLNKADLADPDITSQWVSYFRQNGAGCVSVSSKSRGSVTAVRSSIDKEIAALLEKRARKGMAGAKTRIMVTGIPNVGKSTFINTFAGTASARAADRPGVTRGKQWIAAGQYDLLDMPGVLWKKFDSERIAANLAFIGSIKDDILDMEEVACGLLDEVRQLYPAQLCERYKLTAEELQQGNYELLGLIARRRGMLAGGGEADTGRAASMLCDEFRASKIGRISLERPRP